MNDNYQSTITPIPTKWVGPVKIINAEFNAAIKIPLATLEKPVWFAVNRGAKLSKMCGGIDTVLVQEGMARSVLVEGQNAEYLKQIVDELPQHEMALKDAVVKTSAFTKLQNWHAKIVGNLLYLRFNFEVGDASGHNMATKASDVLLDWLLARYKKLRYVSVSGNFCVDKKVSAVNSILGRGKYVVAEMIVEKNVCLKVLKATPAAIVDLHIKKNLLGSIISGGVCSANAHFANMLLAFYLATGQDAANIVEGSQGLVHAALHGEDLYFSVTLPNIIVGTVGSGKDLDFARKNLELLGCLDKVNKNAVGKNARKLAAIAAASVWCGEISLLAAQTVRGELARSHEVIERC